MPPFSAGRVILTASADPFTRGLDYLYGVRSLALTPDLVDLIDQREGDWRVPICTWIGQNIDRVNAQLNVYLEACHQCFYAWDAPAVQIFAAPLALQAGIDALCNLETQPITLLIDVGRVVPEDWLFLVVHEYAHAHARSPGHHQQFARSLAHLCLGLGIPLPADRGDPQNWLPFYPYCRSTQDPLAFWQGQGEFGRCQPCALPTPIANSSGRRAIA
jgi:hypothetical protein